MTTVEIILAMVVNSGAVGFLAWQIKRAFMKLEKTVTRDELNSKIKVQSQIEELHRVQIYDLLQHKIEYMKEKIDEMNDTLKDLRDKDNH